MRKCSKKAHNERDRRHQKRYASKDNIRVSERQGVVHLSREEREGESHEISYQVGEKSPVMKTTVLTAQTLTGHSRGSERAIATMGVRTEHGRIEKED